MKNKHTDAAGQVITVGRYVAYHGIENYILQQFGRVFKIRSSSVAVEWMPDTDLSWIVHYSGNAANQHVSLMLLDPHQVTWQLLKHSDYKCTNILIAKDN